MVDKRIFSRYHVCIMKTEIKTSIRNGGTMINTLVAITSVIAICFGIASIALIFMDVNAFTGFEAGFYIIGGGALIMFGWGMLWDSLERPAPYKWME